MNKGSASDDCLPKFFKVYLPNDSGDDLAIPISFNSYLPKTLPEYVIVRSIYGNIWKLKLRKCCAEIDKFVMVNGWKRIVKDEELKGGEFLAFEFDGSRLFNFCIYGHTTCKRLGSSVKTKDIKDEDGKASVDIIVIDDDSTDASSDQDSGKEDQSREDIIVIDENTSDDDYDDETRSGVETEVSFEVSNKSHSEEDRQYLDNYMNPFFTVNLTLQSKTDLRIRAKVIKKHGLHFPEYINLNDPLEKRLGKLKRKVEEGHTIKGFDSIIIRNRVKSTDKMICELVKESNGLVREIKVHVISD